jgi:hypothetical protein
MKINTFYLLFILFCACLDHSLTAAENDQPIIFKPFVWQSNPPADCPFEPSDEIKGIQFSKSGSD